VITIRQTEAYATWFDGLQDRQAKARIRIRLDRLAMGNFGDAKPVGEGVSELRINHGPGYRIYCKRRDAELVILLAGGDKHTQSRDIKTVLELAQDL
jgi:putative addiction module killer protein